MGRGLLLATDGRWNGGCALCQRHRNLSFIRTNLFNYKKQIAKFTYFLVDRFSCDVRRVIPLAGPAPPLHIPLHRGLLSDSGHWYQQKAPDDDRASFAHGALD